jgi:AcrR family transcriptional regulator
VFGRLGYAGATTNKIAERAGVSIGSLYQYFANKDEILMALLERHRAENRAAIEASRHVLTDPAVPLAEGLRGLINALLQHHVRDPALSRVLAHGIHGPQDDRAKQKDGDEGYVAFMTEILRSRPEVVAEDEEMAARVVVQTVGQLVRWLGHDAPPTVATDAFVDELVRMLTAYLVPPGHAR